MTPIEALAQIQLTTEIDASWEAMMRPDAASQWWGQYVARYTAIRMPQILKDLDEECNG